MDRRYPRWSGPPSRWWRWRLALPCVQLEGHGHWYSTLGVPLWIFLVGGAALHAFGVVRGGKVPEGACARCGYDLRRAPGEIRPECGSTLE